MIAKDRHENGYEGFTLIELLVVIAIIGILAAIVLASVSGARAKGGDAAVENGLLDMRTQAELDYYNLTPNCYAITGTSCTTAVPAAVAAGACPTTGSSIFADTKIASQISGATIAGGGLNTCASTAGGTAYVVAVQLKTSAALAWCVDSLGNSKQEGTSGGAALTQSTLNALLNGTACK